MSISSILRIEHHKIFSGIKHPACPRIKGYLTDTYLTAQDYFKALLDYFRIKY